MSLLGNYGIIVGSFWSHYGVIAVSSLVITESLRGHYCVILGSSCGQRQLGHPSGAPPTRLVTPPGRHLIQPSRRRLSRCLFDRLSRCLSRCLFNRLTGGTTHMRFMRFTYTYE